MAAGADCRRVRIVALQSCRERSCMRPAPRHSRFGGNGADIKSADKTGRNAMFQQALDQVSKQVLIRDRYDNFIGGKWIAPTQGKYFDNPSPITGKRLCEVPRSTAEDIELALDAAHK